MAFILIFFVCYSSCFLATSQMRFIIFSIACTFLQVSHQSPISHWNLLPHSMFWYLRIYITCSEFESFFSNLFHFIRVLFISCSCGRGWHFGPPTSAMPGVARGVYKRRRWDWGHCMDEEWSEGCADGKLVSGAAGGKLRWRQLQLSQQGRITPQSHCGPDPRDWKSEEDSCELWPRYGLN